MFVDLFIQHAMRMRHIVICGLPRSKTFFPHYLINGTISEEKKLLNTKCVFWFSLQLLSETFLILRIHGHINVRRFSRKGFVILVIFYWKLKFLARFSKKYSNTLFFFNFAKAPKPQFINPLKPKRRPLYLKPQSVPRCKHFSSRL